MEDNFTSWDKEQEVWQVVSGLGRSIQDCQSYLREFLYGGDAARRTSTQGAEWKILEEILPKCLARRLKMKMVGIWISPLALFLGQCWIFNFVFLEHV